MSRLYVAGPERVRCIGPISPDPYTRSEQCLQEAVSVALPLEQPICQDHLWDFQRTRDLTAFDVERAHCTACLDVQQGSREARKEERRGRRAEGPRPAPRRGRDERWCEAHDAQAFAQWKEDQAAKKIRERVAQLTGRRT